MGKRTLTGLGIFLVTALFVASRYLSIYFFDVFVMAISFVSCFEVLKLYAQSPRKSSKMYIYLSMAYVYVVYLAYLFADNYSQALLYQLFLFALFFIISFVAELIYLAKHRGEEFASEDLLLSTKRLLTTMLYPTTLLGAFYGINSFNLDKATVIIALVFGVSMFTDVFAYLVGVTFHKGKFAEQISPKKSISGAIGGLVGGLLFAGLALGICYFADVFNPFTLPTDKTLNIVLFFVLTGLLGSLMTEFGDLVASSLKRVYGVKDFGKIFPGHGGMMDRVDGLMFCGAVTYILSMLFLF